MFNWAELVLALLLFVAGPGAGFYAIWTRLGSIETKLDGINGRVDKHDVTIAVHDEKLDRLTAL